MAFVRWSDLPPHPLKDTYHTLDRDVVMGCGVFEKGTKMRVGQVVRTGLDETAVKTVTLFDEKSNCIMFNYTNFIESTTPVTK